MMSTSRCMSTFPAAASRLAFCVSVVLIAASWFVLGETGDGTHHVADVLGAGGGNGLIGDDACGGGAGGQRDRGAGQLGQVAAVDGELADGADLAFIDVQEPSIGAQPGIDGAGGADRGAAQ